MTFTEIIILVTVCVPVVAGSLGGVALAIIFAIKGEKGAALEVLSRQVANHDNQLAQLQIAQQPPKP